MCLGYHSKPSDSPIFGILSRFLLARSDCLVAQSNSAFIVSVLFILIHGNVKHDENSLRLEIPGPSQSLNFYLISEIDHRFVRGLRFLPTSASMLQNAAEESQTLSYFFAFSPASTHRPNSLTPTSCIDRSHPLRCPNVFHNVRRQLCRAL